MFMHALPSALIAYPDYLRRQLTPDANAAFAEKLAHTRERIGTSQDCAMRKLAYEFAGELQPWRAPHRDVFDALELESICGELPPPGATPRLSHDDLPAAASTMYVNVTGGDDSNSGTISAPLATPHAALVMLRNLKAPRVMVLRGGVHFLADTLNVTAADGDLSIVSAPGEAAWLSGGALLPTDVSWTRVVGEQPVWRAVLPEGFGDVLGLHALMPDGSTIAYDRARHPNRKPEDGTMEHGLWSPAGAVWTKPAAWPAPALTVWVRAPNDTSHHAGECGTHFTYGVGGPCARFEPPGGYLCSANATGGGYGWEEMVPGSPAFPVGVSVPAAAWSDAGVPPPSTWASAAQTGTAPVLETWTNGWATTFWEVGDVEGDAIGFRAGGQQIGRGFHADGKDQPLNDAGPWKVENALELLDQAQEWFYAPATHELTVQLNGTDVDPSKLGIRWIVPQLRQLVRIVGSGPAPVANVSLVGVGLRDAAYTYLDAWGVPSGGDWALHRGGALFIEGASGVAVRACAFEHLATNAIFLSGFVRAATITNSTFDYLGESAVALWGDTADVAGAPAGRLPPGVGIDGEGGNQPRGTTFSYNRVSNLGLTERQSSAFGEFQACESLVEGNIVFNIPRAAVNINDGFGGGTDIRRNLLFNTCRESGDHGPFNSWDRIPYLVHGSLQPRYNLIRHNFIFSNYGAGFGVDNDDTSSYYNITSNVFVGGGGVKCDYDGHDKYFSENVMVGQRGGAACHHTCAYRKPFTDHCFNNTIVQATVANAELGQLTDPFTIIWFCTASDPSVIMPDYDNSMLPVIHSNRIYNADGHGANVTCGYSGPVADTLVPLSRFLEVGLMPNTTVGPLPTDDVLVGWCKEALSGV